MGASMPCRCASRTISPLKKSVSTLPVLRLNDCQVELLGPVFRPGTGRSVGPSARAAVDSSSETNSIPACLSTYSPFGTQRGRDRGEVGPLGGQRACCVGQVAQ